MLEPPQPRSPLTPLQLQGPPYWSTNAPPAQNQPDSDGTAIPENRMVSKIHTSVSLVVQILTYSKLTTRLEVRYRSISWRYLNIILSSCVIVI